MSMNMRMRQKSLLEKAAEKRVLSHVYLFSGNDHIRKNELIESLLAILGVQPADHIRVCPAGDKAGAEITIAQIRSVTNFLAMTAWNSPYKIAVIQHAHSMNKEAQSAFLKLLEEPKGDTVLFLLCEHPGMLLDTIRSRTQEFKFYALTPAKISDRDTLEFQELQKADLTARFGLAKNLADAPEQIAETLQTWLVMLRQLLRAALRENPQNAFALVHTIRIIQETSMLLRTTNINPRLALERVMLNL